MSLAIMSLRIEYEHDVVAARQRTRQIAEAIGFDVQQQTRLSTAVSEIARNAYSYARGGKVEFSVEGTTRPQLFCIRVSDSGSGIPDIQQILDGKYRSATGMGLGILGAQRLMDRFAIDARPGFGTTVTLAKLLPRSAPLLTVKELPEVTARLARAKPKDILDEFREQNQELLRTLEELQKRQRELISLNRELEDTNRGVVALYAELDERADHLRRADEVKSTFLSNMSHEFRTPLNSILALSRILLERTDGDLTPEQEKQVGYIRKAGESLLELVNDLLDLAKVEAGKIEVHPAEFKISNLFGALRGMLRPLLVSKSVNLVFEEPENVPPMFSDEGKVSQILRNFISNALKYTEAGEVRVSADYDPSDRFVIFRVTDTGIGIAPEHQEEIFQEFTQLDNPLQRRVKGTGLGLPLSRKLSELLGGSVGVESQTGLGSTFTLRAPRIYKHAEEYAVVETPPLEPSRIPVLLLEDHYHTRLVYENYFRASPFQILFARSVREAENVLRNVRPKAIILDVLLEGEDAWDLLARLKSEPSTKSIPILVATTVDDRGKAMALGADAYAEKPVSAEVLREQLNKLTGEHPWKAVLLVDDEEVSRYLLKQVFGNPTIRFVEASNGSEGVEAARREKPDLAILDLAMPEKNGFVALEEMAADPSLRNIPVIVATSKVLSAEQRRYLDQRALAVLPKEMLSGRDIRDRLLAMLSSVGLEDLVSGRASAAGAGT
jgi:signal transduction histidine kinase/CheY-like chemotaxis protein